MSYEVHVRPMILPMLRGEKTTRVEVDLWKVGEWLPPYRANPCPREVLETIKGVCKVEEEYIVPVEYWREFSGCLCESYRATLVVEQDPGVPW